MLLPSQYPEVARWSSIRELLRIQADMQFADLRTLLCLPRRAEPGLDAGCNLTAATLAFNIIAGTSVLFWESSMEALKPGPDRGRRFNDLLREKYPWTSEDDVDPELGAKAMWEYARSPLSHTLGVGKAAHLFPGHPNQRTVWLSKSENGLPAYAAEELMSSYIKPDWLSPTITIEYGSHAIHVDTLAWGICRMLRELFADDAQASAADATARRLLHLH